MTVFPFAIDSDADIFRIDNNGLSEIGADVINQLRGAVFAIEENIGVQANGSLNSIADRFSVSHNADGTIKASALTAVGLVTLPIDNSDVGDSAGIKEYKLSLDYSTASLNTAISANTSLLLSLTAFTNETASDFNLHLSGSTFTSDGITSAKHVLSHIDLNSAPNDSRDPSYSWTGLLDKNGNLRGTTNAATALLLINDELVDHQNTTNEAHPATAITVNSDNFVEIPVSVTTVQAAIEYLDDAEVAKTGEHRAVHHAAGIPPRARQQSLTLPDGYSENVVSVTPITAYLIHPPNTSPVDDLSIGDDVIKFSPTDNTSFSFDAQFSQIQKGDVVTIDYGLGFSTQALITAVHYTPGLDWRVRIDRTNLCEADGYARIDRPSFTDNVYGVLAVASANGTPTGSFNHILSSVIVGNPRGACALGLGFDAGQLNETHYNLYLELYPSGNPGEKVIQLPAIDVTGNEGATPGKYTLESVVQQTNNSLREIGFNYRMIAFAHEGEFGIMLSDAVNNASFAIVKGINSSGSITTGSYTENVIGGNDVDDFDALGLGESGSNIASPTYQSSWVDSTAAQYPTKVISPARGRNYIVNGRRLDEFATTYLANDDGYWDGYISARNTVGSFSVETTYTVEMDLSPAGLKAGKTILIQPAIAFTDSRYSDVDYGRFIIKSVNFIGACGESAALTQITVINGLHAYGSGFGFSSSEGLPVRLHFGYDSVGFNFENLINQSPTSLEYHRFHEIFINDEGKTFSNERARLPRQNESGQLLSTDNWHILDVSPKLRGYRDTDPLAYNKYVRFYVLGYDSSTGEFDGYLGKRVSGTDDIISVGPVVRGKKNIVTRFYDETHIDYIDLLFEEVSTYPGSSILSGSNTLSELPLAEGEELPYSTANSRYVDIEIFPTLQTHDELLLLATCEVNWDPASGQNVIQHVINRRQFGSIDEADFTQSAKEFIQSGEKYLHENGIIRGLALDSFTEDDSGEIFFKGGLALVNGKICPVNNSSVTIPQIYPRGTSLPQNMDWAICVNEKGNLTSIIITNSKAQFFATPGSNNYLLPSATFEELIATRKDLTPIALVNVTIASLIINKVKDVRKFVYQADAAHITVTADTFTGNFHSIEALGNWMGSFAGVKPIVTLKGEFNVNELIDLSIFTNGIHFMGNGAVINVTAPRGFLLTNNITFENITFNYSVSDISYQTNNVINSDNGCIFGQKGINLNNIVIKDCTFNYLNTTQRPPFISFKLEKAQELQSIKIIRNSFNDNSPSTSLGESQAAVSIFSDNDGAGTNPSLVLNTVIEDNICNYKQGIWITQIKGASTAEIPGINVYNTRISKNSCGKIGYIVSSVVSSSPTLMQHDRSQGLLIEGNQCILISTSFDDESIFYAYNIFNNAFGTGDVVIKGNFCSSIDVSFAYKDGEISSLKIEGNILRAIVSGNIAINISSYLMDTEAPPVSIINNFIDSGIVSGSAITYVDGIDCLASSNIHNNIIKGFTNQAILVGLRGTEYSISNNKMYRGGNSISRYIYVVARTVNDNGVQGTIIDNYFDSFTTNGSDTDTTIVNNSNGFWNIQRNKNHFQTTYVRGDIGVMSISDGSSASEIVWHGNEDVGALNESEIKGFYNGNQAFSFQYQDYSTTAVARWNIPLCTVLPQGAIIKSISTNVSVFSTTGATTMIARMAIYDRVRTSGDEVEMDPITTTPNQLLLDETDYTNFQNGSYRALPTLNPMLRIEIESNGSSLLMYRVSEIIISYLAC